MTTPTAPAIAARAAEIVAHWDEQERLADEHRRQHAEWVEYMTTVERIRPETLPCHHGTSFWPDFGQVCSYCESEYEDVDDRTPEEIERGRYTAALEQATREHAMSTADPYTWLDDHPF